MHFYKFCDVFQKGYSAEHLQTAAKEHWQTSKIELVAKSLQLFLRKAPF